MREVKFKIYHQGCFASELTEKFTNSLELSLIGTEFTQRLTYKKVSLQAFFKLSSDSKKVNDEFIKLWRQRKDTVELSVFNSSPTGDPILYCHQLEKNYLPSHDVVLRNKGIVLNNVLARNGYEHYHVLLPDPKSSIKMLNELESIGEVKILKIGEQKEDKNLPLTKKQQDSIEKAILYGYYSWPKNVTLDELAKKEGIARSVFQEHLRKAESKIMSQYVPDLLRAKKF